MESCSSCELHNKKNMAALKRAYNTALHQFPTLVQSLQAGSLMAVGDIASQFVIEGHKLQQYEWRRSVHFFALGTFLVGPTLKVWYGVLEKSFGSANKTAAFKKVLLDQSFFAPSFIVIFLSASGALQGNSVSEIKSQIKRDYTDILTSNYMVWPAVQVCNFSLVPLHHQVLFVQTFALFWNTYLAWKINK